MMDKFIQVTTQKHHRFASCWTKHEHFNRTQILLGFSEQFFNLDDFHFGDITAEIANKRISLLTRVKFIPY